MNSLFHNYSRWELEIEKGSGSYVWDKEGKQYLDFTSGIGVCNLGHVHPAVLQAVEAQLQKVWHTSNLFQSNLQEKTAQLLIEDTPFQKVFFCNSGAEANEGAIKLARKHTGKSKIVTCEQSFHGRTYGAMAATGQDKIKVGFGPMLSDFETVPYNQLQLLKEAADTDTAAVMLEVVQGEGGVIPAEEPFLKGVQDHCQHLGILLIIDEVQTGIGRTGHKFAFQHFGLEPDIVTTAKGLGNGFPVGAVIGKESLNEAFGPGSHGTTFGGNPLAMSAASAVLHEIAEDSFMNEVIRKGHFFLNVLNEEIQGNPEVLEIRGLGLMIGIEFKSKTAPLITELRNSGFLSLPAGEYVLRLLPPLTVSDEELLKAASTIGNLLKKQV